MHVNLNKPTPKLLTKALKSNYFQVHNYRGTCVHDLRRRKITILEMNIRILKNLNKLFINKKSYNMIDKLNCTKVKLQFF